MGKKLVKGSRELMKEEEEKNEVHLRGVTECFCTTEST
jgi:hypothetical protein